MIYYKHWPVVMGKRVYPIWILAFGLGCLIRDYIFLPFIKLGEFLLGLVHDPLFWSSLYYIFLALSALVLIVFLRIGLVGVCKFESCQLFFGMLKARKQKICPIVEIVGSEDESVEATT
jgi:hypothetical protein